MRRHLPWLLAVPLMATGSLAAHGLSSLAGSGVHEHGRELAGRSNADAAAHSVVAVGMLVALLIAAGTSWLVLRLRGRSRGAPAWLFFFLPPLAFAAQEIVERLLYAEAAPFSAALEPRFLLGLALQLPFGLAALAVAWLLLRAAHRIVRALQRPPQRRRRHRTPSTPAPSESAAPRIPALALGYPQRGPPLR